MSRYMLKSPVSSMTVDSRQVKPGSLFLAYPGEHNDGRNYIADAIDRGAAAVLWDPQDFVWNDDWQVENVPIKRLKFQAGVIADQFYQKPSEKLWMIGVTGTNGKTSISQWLSQCLNHLGRKTAVIGTLGNGFPNQLTPAQNTTPDAVVLQALLDEYVKAKAEAVAMEVSSHGLDQGRVNGVHFDVAVLSNLTRDHLDYHKTMEHYAAAKRRLFQSPGLQWAVVNTDDLFGKSVEKEAEDKGLKVMRYGIDSGDVRASEIVFEETGMRFMVNTPYGEAQIQVSLVGRFNVYNVLAVLATLLCSNVMLEDAVAAVAQIQSAHGRMQQIGGGKLPLVVIDYAHTPDALEQVLKALREQTQNKLICVFGCGGNRDAGKRPLMGKVVSELADAAVVTSDNPRDEDPQHIIQEILAGMEGKFAVEEDRAKAIAVAISNAAAGDVVLIAGKGHEYYQEVGGNKQYFSDFDQAQKALKKYEEVQL